MPEGAQSPIVIRADDIAALIADPRLVFEGLPVLPYVDVIGATDRRHVIAGAVEEVLGLSAAEYEEATHEELLAMAVPEDRPTLESMPDRHRRQLGELLTITYRMVGRSGHTRWFRDVSRASLAEDGTLVVRGVMIDVTAEKQSELALAAAESLSRQVISSADVGIVVLDLDLRYRIWNRYVEELSDHTVSLALGLTPEEAYAPSPPPFVDYMGKLRRALDGEVVTIADAQLHLLPDGTQRYGHVTATPLRDDSDAVVGVLVLNRDVTARELAEQTLKRRDLILDAVSLVARLLLEQRLEDCAQQVLALLGEAVSASRAAIFAFEQVGGWITERQLWEWCAEGIPHDVWDDYVVEGSALEGIHNELRAGNALHGPIDRLPVAIRPRLREAGVRSAVFVPIFVDGRLWGTLDFDDCVSERVWSAAEIDAMRTATSVLGAGLARQRAEEALRESESLRGHSQRMEAVGRLAGGLAHDFNNLLTVIHGHLDLARAQLPADSESLADLDQIALAADRASTLTRQLLTFSRRQVIQRRVVDLNAVIGEIDAMLEQMLDERVELQFKLTPEHIRVVCDAAQVQQVLVNLVVNAGDAMPDGGQIEIETAIEATAPGEPRRVLLAVTDTGGGIDESIRPHIFEPFFTTKPRGEGVGLGLATVHGIVTGAGGEISIDSTTGWGTTFLVRFPEAQEPVTMTDDVDAGHGEISHRGTERVLVVEDEASVRLLVQTVLEKRGYTVFAASDGIEGLGIARAHGASLDLVVTDVVMPRMSGRELADRLRRELPDLPVVMMSGYTDGEFAPRTPLDPSIPFLQKAFSPAELARTVRETLDVAAAERAV
ncbi:MAG: ATP-binding protein [Gaiella sp.]